MKTGPVILSIFALALLAFLIYSPVTPPAASQESEVAAPAESPEIAADDPDARVEEALRNLQSGATPPMEAIVQIREVAEQYPDNVKANFTLGVLSIETGQYEKAIGRFKTVTAQQPGNGEAWKLLAQSQLRAGDTVNAKVSFEKALPLVDEKTRAAYKEELPELSIN